MQLSGVFGKCAVADLGKSELAFDDAEGVFDFCPSTGFELLNGFKDSVRFELGGVAPIKPDTVRPNGLGCTAVVISSASPYVGATRCNH
jgi:hypothetical protein